MNLIKKLKTSLVIFSLLFQTSFAINAYAGDDSDPSSTLLTWSAGLSGAASLSMCTPIGVGVPAVSFYMFNAAAIAYWAADMFFTDDNESNLNEESKNTTNDQYQQNQQAMEQAKNGYNESADASEEKAKLKKTAAIAFMAASAAAIIEEIMAYTTLTTEITAYAVGCASVYGSAGAIAACQASNAMGAYAMSGIVQCAGEGIAIASGLRACAAATCACGFPGAFGCKEEANLVTLSAKTLAMETGKAVVKQMIKGMLISAVAKGVAGSSDEIAGLLSIGIAALMVYTSAQVTPVARAGTYMSFSLEAYTASEDSQAKADAYKQAANQIEQNIQDLRSSMTTQTLDANQAGQTTTASVDTIEANESGFIEVDDCLVQGANGLQPDEDCACKKTNTCAKVEDLAGGSKNSAPKFTVSSGSNVVDGAFATTQSLFNGLANGDSAAVNGAVNSLAAQEGAIRREFKKQIKKLDKLRKKQGLPPVNLEKRSQNFSKIAKKLNRSTASKFPATALAIINSGTATKEEKNKAINKLADDMSKKVIQSSIDMSAVKNNYSLDDEPNFGDMSDQNQESQSAESTLSKIADDNYIVDDSSIIKDKSVSIFKIITNRYLRSGVKRLFRGNEP